MQKDKIKGTHDYLIALVKKAERKLYYETTNDHISFNEACDAENEARHELDDAKKELNNFEIKNNIKKS